MGAGLLAALRAQPRSGRQISCRSAAITAGPLAASSTRIALELPALLGPSVERLDRVSVAVKSRRARNWAEQVLVGQIAAPELADDVVGAVGVLEGHIPGGDHLLQLGRLGVAAPPGALEDPALGRRGALLVLAGVAVGAELELLLLEPALVPTSPSRAPRLPRCAGSSGQTNGWLGSYSAGRQRWSKPPRSSTCPARSAS